MKNYKYSIIYFLVTCCLIANCKKETISNAILNNDVIYDSTAYDLDYGTFPAPVIAADNRLTVQGVLLGKMLFYDKQLSKNNTIACASCHKQENAFTDVNKFSKGVQGLTGNRNSMAIFNMAWHNNGFFWDGRASLLRHQSLMPIEDTLEMFEKIPNVINKLSLNYLYRNQFKKAFGSTLITDAKIALALEQFMKSIVSNKSKYDNFLDGNTTLTPSEENGRQLFFKEYNKFFPAESGAECSHCHGGFNFENDEYMNNGLNNASSITDIGREKVTGIGNDKAKFKVPSLRNIALTAPYMHDGRFTTLEQVLDHYNSGLKESAYLDPALENTRSTGLRLSIEQKADVVNFLKTLTDYSLLNDKKYAMPN